MIIVILDERLTDEEREELLEVPPIGKRWRKPVMAAVPSESFPASTMYLVKVGTRWKEWLRVYHERGVYAFSFPTPKILASVRYKTKLRFKG